MICWACHKRVWFWEKHDESGHTRCRRVWEDGHTTAWRVAKDTVRNWRLPDLDRMYIVDDILPENPTKALIEERAAMERTIRHNYTEGTVENGMLAEGSFTPTPTEEI